MINRRNFLTSAGAFAAAGMLSPGLLAAMKYKRNEVLKLFRAQAGETDARVKAGIEGHRKGPMKLVFKNSKGKLLENVHVKVTQKTHDFKYGADLFMLDEIGDDPRKNDLYKDRFAEAFNIATLPFYWSDLEPEEGKTRYAKNSPKIYRRPPPDLCVEWCQKNGIEPKAHCLNYPRWQPKWAVGDIHREKSLLEKHFRQLAERYSSKIPMWEVTNETFWGTKDRSSNFYHQSDFIEWSFKTAERYFSPNKLIINDAHCRIWNDEWFHYARSPYYMQIENALLKGARIDSIGLQFHMFHGSNMKNVIKESKVYYDPSRLFEVMDVYAKLGKPLQITEITIPAYSYDPGDEEVQAEIMRELYRIWFSHPAMEAIIYWNLPDGYAAFAKAGDFSGGENAYYGGLCRFDMTPKPAYKVVTDLFGKEWRTNFERDAAGCLSFRGFHGKYEIEATSNGKTVKTEFRVNPAFSPEKTIVI